MDRELRRVSLPIRPCSPVCVWRARTDLASFHVTRAGKTLGYWDLAVPVRTLGVSQFSCWGSVRCLIGLASDRLPVSGVSGSRWSVTVSFATPA